MNFSQILLEAAGDAASGQETPSLGSSIMSLVLPIGIFAIVAYFLLYRPQKKQGKAVTEMRNSIKVGDEISTNGGILGRVIQLKEDFLVIETSGERTKLKIAKWAVRQVENKSDVEADALKPAEAGSIKKNMTYKIKKK